MAKKKSSSLEGETVGVFGGNTADFGKGLVIDDNDEVLGEEANLLVSKIYDASGMDTRGLMNVGGFSKKVKSVGKTSKGFNLAKVVEVSETPRGVLISGGSVSKGEVLDTMKKPDTLRSRKILAFDADITEDDARKVLLEVNNSIVGNNAEKDRADTLNIYTIPIQEWNRQYFLGEVEKSAFGEYGVKPLSVSDNEKKVKKDIENDIRLIDQTNKKIKKIELLVEKDRVGTEVESQRSINARRQIDNERRSLRGGLKYFPTEVAVKDPSDGKTEVSVNDIDYEVLSDPMYGRKANKVVVNGFSVDGSRYGEPITFKNNVIEEIVRFQPDVSDNSTPDYYSSDKVGVSTARIVPNPVDSPVLTKEMREMFYSPNKNAAVAKWIKEDPDNQIKYDAVMNQINSAERSSGVTLPISCQSGAVPIIRKRSDDAWGMTPKQLKCSSDTIAKRMRMQSDYIDSHQKEVAEEAVKFVDSARVKGAIEKWHGGKGVIGFLKKKYPDLYKVASEKVLSGLYSHPEYKRVVGCDTPEELKKVREYESYESEIKDLVEVRDSIKDPSEKKEANRAIARLYEEMAEKNIKPHIVPIRFPTKNAVGDTMYCKTVKNTAPNVEYTFDIRKTRDPPSDREIEGMQIRGEIVGTRLEKPAVYFRDGSRKKRVLVVKQDPNKE